MGAALGRSPKQTRAAKQPGTKPKPPVVAAPAMVEILLSSAPPQATVYVDGSKVGYTPVRHALPPGEHLLRFERDLDESEHEITVSEPHTYTWQQRRRKIVITP